MNENFRNFTEALTPVLKKANTWRIVFVIIFAIIGIVGVILDINQTVLGYCCGLYSFSMVARSLGPELGGIVIGVAAIDYFNERRQIEQFGYLPHSCVNMGCN